MKENDPLQIENSKVKTWQELGITPHQWIILAESLLLSREFVEFLPYSELSVIHKMNVDHLEVYFGLKEVLQSKHE